MKFNFLLPTTTVGLKLDFATADNPFCVLVFEEVTHPFHEKGAIFESVEKLSFPAKIKKTFLRRKYILHMCTHAWNCHTENTEEKSQAKNVNYILQAMSQQIKVSLEKVLLFSFFHEWKL